MNFGKKLKYARIRNAMTQAELGEKMEVSQATISQWENGNVLPSLRQKKTLNTILGEWLSAKGDKSTEDSPGALGAWLTRVRLSKKISVPELAAIANLSVPAIYNIESGRILNPRKETVLKIEKALSESISTELKEEIKEEATIEGLGEFVGFDPHNKEDLPKFPGIYVLYDVSDRPVYIGQGMDVRARILKHADKFWFKYPIVDTAAFVEIDNKDLREKIERLLIRFLKSNAVINIKDVKREEVK